MNITIRKNDFVSFVLETENERIVINDSKGVFIDDWFLDVFDNDTDLNECIDNIINFSEVETVDWVLENTSCYSPFALYNPSCSIIKRIKEYYQDECYNIIGNYYIIYENI